MAAPDYSALPYKAVLVRLEGAVAVVLFNRAKQRNSFGGDATEAMIHIFDLLDRDDRVRAVVLTAETSTNAFCAGADVSGGWNLMWKAESEKEGVHAHRDQGGQVAMAIYRCRKPTIVAINGHAAGVGATALQLPFDFRFVWSGANITFGFVRIGIPPEGTATHLLPRLLGHARASALLLSGKTVTPASPLIRDLYYSVLPARDAVFPAALALAQDLAAGTSQTAYAYSKALLQRPGASVEESHLLESRAQRLLAQSADGEEGINAFRERRKPSFKDTLSQAASPWYPWWSTVDVRFRASKL